MGLPGKNHKQILEEVIENVKISTQVAKRNIEQARIKQKIQYDKKAKVPSYTVGQKVWLYSSKIPIGLSAKLHNKWKGPYVILESGPNFTFKLKECANSKEMKSLVHANRLKPFYDP